MKTLQHFLSVLTLICATPVFADTPPIVNPYGRFYEGDGVEVEVAQFVAKNQHGLQDVLLKITGAHAFNDSIDGKTLKYQAIPGGNGINYQAAGKNRMMLRKGNDDALSVIHVFVDEKVISVSEDKARSKSVMPLHLLTEFQSN
jgi:hypothetical protein